ncbi:MAG: potassium-transporting ATPase subunit KdpC [Gemmatimonas sp.]
MFSQIKRSVMLVIVMTILTGAMYPAAITSAAQLLFPSQANGSLVEVDGKVVGSALVGQTFTKAYYFHSRPSAAGSGYDGAASSGTNKGPTDTKTVDTVLVARIDTAVSADGAQRGKIPTDMVTASGSGLDPHISPANAQLQVARVASARNVDAVRVSALVEAHIEARQFGFFGERRVNVLLLNVALDSAFGRVASTTSSADSIK